MPHNPPLVLQLLAFLALTPGLAGAAAALTASVDPSSPDFSAQAKSYPWVLAPEFLAKTTIDLAKRNPDSNYYEEKVVTPRLPELFRLADSTSVTTTAQWETRRRPELLALFASEVYGVAPPKPADLAFRVVESEPKALEGRATLKRIKISFSLGGESFSFPLTLFVPNNRAGKAPVLLLLNHRGTDNTDPTRKIRSDFWPAEYVVARGYAVAAINVAADVEPDVPKATTGLRQFYRTHYAGAETLTWATLAAWAWSGSRAVDYFETDPDIDRARVAIVGHSRGAKTALWAGASDTRYALTCVSGTGEGGSSLVRRNFGETLAAITTNYPHWFTPKYATYGGKVDTLPVDTHELIALVAPRGYHAAEATLDVHADPRGSWLALLEAQPVWALYGLTKPVPHEMPLVHALYTNGPIADHMREGVHDLTAYNWKCFLDHADLLFRK